MMRSGPTRNSQLKSANAAGIYGATITASIMTTAGDSLATAALALSVLITLVVYWLAEQYAEVPGEQTAAGRFADVGTHPDCASRQLAHRERLIRAVACTASCPPGRPDRLRGSHGRRADRRRPADVPRMDGGSRRSSAWLAAGGHHISRSSPRARDGRAQEPGHTAHCTCTKPAHRTGSKASHAARLSPPPGEDRCPADRVSGRRPTGTAGPGMARRARAFSASPIRRSSAILAGHPVSRGLIFPVTVLTPRRRRNRQTEQDVIPNG
jgi:hypothetical protein